jgi:hypothetical protein
VLGTVPVDAAAVVLVAVVWAVFVDVVDAVDVTVV